MSDTLPPREPGFWNDRYREGRDGWELGAAAPPLQSFLTGHPLAPSTSSGLVLVPGCGRGHEAGLLADLGFQVVGLDFSAMALADARRLRPEQPGRLQWLQADLFDAVALEAAGLAPASLEGVLEHTCFCAIDPAMRAAYLSAMAALLRPGGWLLGLFWCHRRPGGPPWGSDPQTLAAQLADAGLRPQLWEPAQGSVPGREDEWLGLWRKPG